MTIEHVGALLIQLDSIRRDLEFLQMGLCEGRTECELEVVRISTRRIADSAVALDNIARRECVEVV